MDEHVGIISLSLLHIYVYLTSYPFHSNSKRAGFRQTFILHASKHRVQTEVRLDTLSLYFCASTVTRGLRGVYLLYSYFKISLIWNLPKLLPFMSFKVYTNGECLISTTHLWNRGASFAVKCLLASDNTKLRLYTS